MNSDTRMPACFSVATARPTMLLLAGDIEPAFGGAFGAPLRHEAGGMRLGLQRDRDHVVGRRHFEIERLGNLGLQPRDVVVADVAAILAQMRGDAVGAGLLGELGRAHRIGMTAAARVADGGDMIDVDAKAQERKPRRSIRCQPLTRAALATTALARNCAMIAVRCLRS